MKREIVVRLLAAVALSTVLASAHAIPVPITYSLHFDGSNGSTLDGSITTDGTIGGIFTSNIIAMAFTSNLGRGFSFDDSSPSFGFQCIGVAGCFLATPAELVLDPDGEVIVSVFRIGLSGSGVEIAKESGVKRIQWTTFAGAGVVAIDFNERVRRSGPVSIAASRPVPEPGTVLLSVLAIALCGRATARRNRERERTMAALA